MSTDANNELSSTLAQLQTLVGRAQNLLHENKSLIQGIGRENAERVDSVVDVVCRRMSVKRKLIYMRDRHERVALARQVCMVIVRQELSLSFQSVGKMFNRHHSNVIYAEQAISDLIETDPLFAKDFELTMAEVKKEIS